MKETDIVNSEKFGKTKDFTIYKKRSNKLFPCVELTNWHYKVIPYYKLILYGNNGEKNIISSQVIDVKQGIVQTINTPYKLIGNMSEFCDPFPGFDPKIFEFGIPDDFSEKIKDEMIKLNSIKKEKNYFEENKFKNEENKIKFENLIKNEENKFKNEENKIDFDSEKNKEMTNFQEEEFILNTFKPTLLEKKEEIKNSPKIQEFKNENYIFEAKDKTVEKEFSITNSIFKNNPLLSRIASKEIIEESFVKKPKIEEKTEEIKEEKILEDENSTTGYVEEEISTEKSVNLQINQPIIVKEAKKNFDLTNLGTVKDTVFKINEGLVKKDIDEKQVKENAMKRFEEVSKQEIKEKKFIDEYLFKKTVQLPVNLDISEESSDKSKEEIKNDSSLEIELKEEKIYEETNFEEFNNEEPKEELKETEQTKEEEIKEEETNLEEFNNEEPKEEQIKEEEIKEEEIKEEEIKEEEIKEEEIKEEEIKEEEIKEEEIKEEQIKEEEIKEEQLKEEEKINTTQEEIFLLSQEMKKESENFAEFFKEAKKEKFEIENKFMKNKIFPKKISAKSVRIKKKVSPKKENEIKEEKEENKLTEEKKDQIKEEINEEKEDQIKEEINEEKEDQIKEEKKEEKKPVLKTKKIVKKKRKPITFQGRKK